MTQTFLNYSTLIFSFFKLYAKILIFSFWVRPLWLPAPIAVMASNPKATKSGTGLKKKEKRVENLKWAVKVVIVGNGH